MDIIDMKALEAFAQLVTVLNSNHFAAIVLVALFMIHKGFPPKK